MNAFCTSCFKEGIEKTLSAISGGNVFMGGSRRFGYDRDNSDFDYHILNSFTNDPDFIQIRECLAESFSTELPRIPFVQALFTDIMKAPYYKLTGRAFRILGANDFPIPNIDVFVHSDTDDYVNEYKQHNALELALNDHPKLVDYIRWSRMCLSPAIDVGVGSIVYKQLIHMFDIKVA